MSAPVQLKQIAQSEVDASGDLHGQRLAAKLATKLLVHGEFNTQLLVPFVVPFLAWTPELFQELRACCEEGDPYVSLSSMPDHFSSWMSLCRKDRFKAAEVVRVFACRSPERFGDLVHLTAQHLNIDLHSANDLGLVNVDILRTHFGLSELECTLLDLAASTAIHAPVKKLLRLVDTDNGYDITDRLGSRTIFQPVLLRRTWHRKNGLC